MRFLIETNTNVKFFIIFELGSNLMYYGTTALHKKKIVNYTIANAYLLE